MCPRLSAGAGRKAPSSPSEKGKQTQKGPWHRVQAQWRFRESNLQCVATSTGAGILLKVVREGLPQWFAGGGGGVTR